MATKNKYLKGTLYGVAKMYNGLHEVKDNAKLVKLFANNTTPIDPAKTAWCAAFIEAILRLRGLTGTGKLTARSYLKWGQKIAIEDAKRGDIVILKRGLLPWQGHIGVLYKVRDNTVELLGGNQANSVCIKAYDRRSILGIRRPV